jgi:hypothetical protein
MKSSPFRIFGVQSLETLALTLEIQRLVPHALRAAHTCPGTA